MHHESPEFIERIAADPDDDQPRLIYADWLEERGMDSRAELIRLQCRLSAMPWHDPEHRKLQGQETRLFRKHKSEWLGEFSKWVRTAHFERGFVESISLSPKQYMQSASKIFEVAPVQRISMLQVSDKTARALAEFQPLEHTRGLAIQGHLLTGEGWRTLLASPWLKATELELNLNVDVDHDPTEGVLQGLHAFQQRNQLRSLEFMGLHLDRSDLRESFARLDFPSLRRLSTSWTRTQTLDLITQADYFSNLEYLSVTDEGAAASSIGRINAAETQLKTLRFRNRIGDDVIVEIARSGKFQNLEHLTIERQSPDAGFVREVLRGLPNLQKLKVAGVDFSDFRFPNDALALHTLSATDSHGIDEAFMQRVAESLKLQWLNLAYSGVTDAMIQPLVDHENCQHLRHLNLSGNALTDVSAQRLLESEHAVGLRHLSLKGNDLSDESKKRLRAHYGTGVCTFSR